MKKALLSLSFIVYSLSLMTAQTISTVAGRGVQGYSGDGGPATSADLDDPIAVAFDATGNMYISEGSHATIRMVNTAGIISTIAGNGYSGFSGDGGPATAAEFTVCWSIVSDASGNIYFSDTYSSRVRKINTSGIITTIAGNGGAGHNGDHGPATAAQIGNPGPLLLDAQGNLYIGDWGNSVIRKVNTNDTITTIAGTGTSGYSGDGGLATAAGFSGIYGMAFDNSGNMYITDNPYRVREISNTGYVSTIAGDSSDGGCGGNGQAAYKAHLNSVKSIVIDNHNNMFISDPGCKAVRMINFPLYIYATAGTSVAGYNGDGIAATVAELNSPEGLALDATSNLYIADQFNERIRKVTNPNLSGFGEVNNITEGVTLYPNPNHGSFSIQLSEVSGQKQMVEIYNMLGEKIYSSSNLNSQISIPEIPGIYMYRIFSETGSVIGTGKFVVE